MIIRDLEHYQIDSQANSIEGGIATLIADMDVLAVGSTDSVSIIEQNAYVQNAGGLSVVGYGSNIQAQAA